MGKVQRYYEKEAEAPKHKPPTTPIMETIIAKTNKKKKWANRNAFNNKRKRKGAKQPVTPNPFPDPPPVPKEKLRKYSRGEGLKGATKIKSSIHKEKIVRKDEKIKLGLEQAARTEILLQEDAGYLIIHLFIVGVSWIECYSMGYGPCH